MCERPGDEIFKRLFDQCLPLPTAARWLNVSAETTRRWPQVSLRRAGSVCVHRRTFFSTRCTYARRYARLASVEAIIAVTTLKKMVYVKSAWMKNIPIQAESVKRAITVISVHSTIESHLRGSGRTMRSNSGSTVAGALLPMPRCFCERSTGSVNLGGIIFSEYGSATISFPFNMRFPHYTALLHCKR